ncbi:MAG: AI-2E family transporter [Williamsia sp.]|nr:AI-2E family transporter [Williamsia sp.]
MNAKPLSKSVAVLLLFVLSIGSLYIAKEFLVPVALAGILAMLLLPLGKRIETWGLNRGWSSLLSVLVLLLVASGIIALLSFQITDLTEDMTGVQDRLMKMAEQLRAYISNTLGISKDQQKQMLQKQQASASGNVGSVVTAITGSLMNGLVNLVLVLVYIFLLLFLRNRFRQFVLKLVPVDEKKNAETILFESTRVARQYLGGLALMIGCLWVLYGIGFSIVGVKHALFFAVLCGLLEIVPFVGNLTGTGITVLMAITQGGGSSMILGVLATYLLIQFVQTYILEPLVVGSEVNINPFFTILVIVAGELIWGVPGMILALPLAGIMKVVFDRVPSLQPYGYLIGEDKKDDDGNIMQKVKGWFGRK